jgi:tRNA-2-methylthio-N6-dimethylallyladenosine synthase
MKKASPQTYYIKTLGCQANVADSQRIAGVLEALGLETVKEPEGKNELETLLKMLPKCGVFIVNTCSVRQKSEDKVYGLGKTIKKIVLKTGKKPFVIMAGCMVGSVTGERQRYTFEELRNRTPWVDAYINPSQIMNIPNILLKNGVLSEWAVKKFNSEKVEALRDNTTHAFVNISYGCDNFCAYCVVPYARGKEISRLEEEILKEIKQLVQKGYKKFTLCGQNVNSWGLNPTEKFEIRTGSNQKLPFANLLRKVHEIEGVENISFISSNPFDFTNDLVDVIKLPKIDNYIHIAVQSGNNEVLKKMNRRHTVEEFTGLIKRIIAVKPAAEIGTDIIVGFPGETREQFMDTIELFKKVKFNVAFISIYSPRKGTAAERAYIDDVSKEEKSRRHTELTRVWRQSIKRKVRS